MTRLYRIFFLYLPRLPCHLYLVDIEQQLHSLLINPPLSHNSRSAACLPSQNDGQPTVDATSFCEVPSSLYLRQLLVIDFMQLLVLH